MTYNWAWGGDGVNRSDQHPKLQAATPLLSASPSEDLTMQVKGNSITVIIQETAISASSSSS